MLFKDEIAFKNVINKCKQNFSDQTTEAGYREARENDQIDSKFGFDRVKDGRERTGYLINIHSVFLFPLI